MPVLHVQLLGRFRFYYGDQLVTSISTARAQSLLAYLILHRNALQPRHRLACLFWPDSANGQARANLRNLLFVLRKDLPDADHFFRIETHSLQWQPDAAYTLDLADFETAIAEAEQAKWNGDEEGLCQAVQQAASLYQGDLLPGWYDEWILPERERLRQTYIGWLEQLTLSLEKQQRYRTAIRYAQRLLECDSLHEATYRRLMRLHARNGNKAAGVRTYHTCVAVLRRELTVTPSAPTYEAFEELLKM